ncbi:hypothetical protein, partial [uncultured Methylobacterium sp.]|uniref:hypothetical protein n=1 Tax=uncultured Methylobacterium sp. TaxID=157278 RepID=UPI00259475C4
LGQLAQIRGNADAVEEGKNQIGHGMTLARSEADPARPRGPGILADGGRYTASGRSRHRRSAKPTVATSRRTTTPKNILNSR